MLMLATTVLAVSIAASGTDDITPLLKQAQDAARAGKFALAAEHVGKALEKEADPSLYYLRGRYHFQASKIKSSLEDFDRYVKLVPSRASRQWERGITCYYAGEYKKGAAQFELYQTYHNNDVENSVWRFLCMVPTDGLQRARRVMLPIENDRRLAMMKVYEMYRGKVKPADVLAAINNAPKEQISQEARDAGLFYAYLYIGLYEEVLGHKAEARKYIEKAASKKYQTNGRVNSYMWDVARIHHARMQAAAKAKDATSQKKVTNKPAAASRPDKE